MAKGQFSLVVALYNVAEYVPAFLESLRTQSYPVRDLDIIVVDDGSTDVSADVVERWAQEHHAELRLIRQENAGPGAARNAGLKLAQNTWVTFCDPDDVFHPGYFRAVADFLTGDSNGSAQLLATRLVQFQDGTTATSHTHPLGKKFRLGNVLADLNANPEFIQLHGPTAFLRRSVLQEHALTFDEQIRPKFEDAHLIGRYLAVVEAPVIGVVATARYLYRRNRRTGSSLVAGAWADPRAYDELPRYGYLGMLTAIQERLGHVPQWAQYMVLYDLVWLYIDDKRMHSRTAAATAEQQASMHRLLEQIIDLIDDEVIGSFSVVSQGWVFHNVLRSYYRRQEIVLPVVQEWKRDEQRRTVRYSYLFQGTCPEEKVYVDGAAVVPLAAKTRDHRILGKTLIRERILILPMGGEPEFLLDGKRTTATTDRGVPLQAGRSPEQRPGFDLRPPAVPASSGNPAGRKLAALGAKAARFRENRILHRSLTGTGTLAEIRGSGARAVQRAGGRHAAAQQAAADQRLVVAAGSEPAVTVYRDAWLLMDRMDRADDNAEHLYRYLQRERPDINAWFMLDRGSDDWERLAADGFRLVAYGSDEAVLLVMNAAYKISSHANADIEFPVSRKRFGEGPGRFVFLQHGVTKDDMSRWLNMKKIALMITATAAEQESITGDGNTYDFTSHEVQLTGFPRHDELLKAAEKVPLSERCLILVAPTWREYLRDELAGSPSDEERAERFERSEFGRHWLALLRSTKLRQLCVQEGYQMVFLPHPELASLVPLLELPEHVRAVSYTNIRVQEQLVKSHTLITDYSSIAFDAAYAGSRVLYMQFDGDEIFEGGHVYRKGYFDYRRDGLGPVVTDSEGVVDQLLKRSNSAGGIYTDRIRKTFRYWDKQSSRRTALAIENLSSGETAGM
ncbi:MULTISPECIES: glycosyltransferase [unclassified Arthrobacter]|uniref:bifunctional glycosyltransferase/CDP-glycerol:glycerophosphate glycerophosphotransferase n=1 Tax=unclassified Arthrobacter TaxID=235627 RepID=UPI0024DF7923|nr:MULTISPECIES: glycosyltransferase [unclassified Arthrobacter]MCC9145762.1 bifunctional glycosyltransferase family 2 protein/CDP-glycerol:glycerophosphate glycerophosphotransferase [Arthrobacter sp. zg-Y919]MDK1276991.1 CDP-glycerol glycerophosphotransferase family protein [Arthrobacter sp. zg.Y919]WIB04081.1 CDP-glycerol glycerophosphotransferase family protein [Arthrobacter sp. zg-Y919]